MDIRIKSISTGMELVWMYDENTTITYKMKIGFHSERGSFFPLQPMEFGIDYDRVAQVIIEDSANQGIHIKRKARKTLADELRAIGPRSVFLGA